MDNIEKKGSESYVLNLFNEDDDEYEIEDDEYEININSLNEKFNNINSVNFSNELKNFNSQESINKTSLKQKLEFYIEENEYLKKQISEINNNDLIKEKIKLDNTIKCLEDGNKYLASTLEDYIKECELQKYALDCQSKDLTKYKRKLNYYRSKEEKEKRKEIEINEIINLRNKGFSYRKIAKKYNVSASTIFYRINKALK